MGERIRISRRKKSFRVKTFPRVHLSNWLHSIHSDLNRELAHGQTHSWYYVRWTLFEFFCLLVCLVICLFAVCRSLYHIQAGASVKNLNLKMVEMKNFCDSLALNSSSVYRCRCAKPSPAEIRLLESVPVWKSPFCVFCFGIFSFRLRCARRVPYWKSEKPSLALKLVPGVCSRTNAGESEERNMHFFVFYPT